MCLCIQLLVFNIINIDCVNILGAPTPQEIKLDLVFIVLLKVAHNNRQWQRHGQCTADRAECPDKLAEAGDGEDVPVADGGHGDDDPVEGGRDVREAGIEVHLYVVAEAGEVGVDCRQP